MRFRGQDPGEPGSPSSHAAGLVWYDVNWTYVEPAPVGLATGFEVVLYTGINQNDGATYLVDPLLVPIADRRLVIAISQDRGVTLATVNAAVRTIYPWGKSAWAIAGASVSSTAGQTLDVGGDNLIPNPTSELGAAATGVAAAGLVLDTTNSYAGSYCRKMATDTVGPDLRFTQRIACVYGDQFTFSCYVKASSASNCQPRVELDFYNAALTFIGDAYILPASTTSYQQFTVRGAVMAGAMYVMARISNNLAVAGGFMYVDNLSLRRSVNYTQLAADEGFRLGNGMGNTGSTSNDRTYYRGNNDPTALGGAPAISCLTVTPQTWDTTAKFMAIDFKLQPASANSNLDGMRYAKVVLYRQSVVGTTATLTVIRTYYVPLKDRLYNNSTDSNAANAVLVALNTFDPGVITAGSCPAMLLTLYNAVGPSDSNCFYSGTGWVAGAALTNNGTSFPAGVTGGTAGGGGGGSGGGGACPAPWVMIDLPDDGGPVQCRADELVGNVGKIVKTIHTATGTRGPWPVKAASIEEGQERWDVFLVGREDPLTFSKDHRMMTRDEGWKEVFTLVPGDTLTGYREEVVDRVDFRDIGPVVRLTIDQAAGYCTAGLLSSNIKA